MPRNRWTQHSLATPRRDAAAEEDASTAAKDAQVVAADASIAATDARTPDGSEVAVAAPDYDLGGCGCSSTGAPALALLFAVAATRRRRA